MMDRHPSAKSLAWESQSDRTDHSGGGRAARRGAGGGRSGSSHSARSGRRGGTEDTDSLDDISSTVSSVSGRRKRGALAVLSPQNKRPEASAGAGAGRPAQRVSWTPTEEHYLRAGVDRFGVGQWAQILMFYDFNPVRTNVNLKDKWRNMNK